MLLVIFPSISDLTLDMTADQNPSLDERVNTAIHAEDPDMVLDLRHLNRGCPNDTFTVFFDSLLKKVEHITAVDNRRHGVSHFSEYISNPDLIRQVTDDVPEGTPIPSESTVLFSFVPKNAHAKSSKLYKSNIPLQFKVQTRQLRSSHMDQHYCSAIFKYMRHFAVLNRDNVSFFCVDDKSKVDFGEPGNAISSGVRGKKSIVPTTSNLSALDHDQSSKGSITPSVSLLVDLPTEENGSFYSGKVFVKYKDSVFQPSSPFRHAIELESILQTQENSEIRPILMIYSDGGPDHRVTYHSVKLSLILIFERLGIDLLVAARTAPGNSWANPAERIMSLLNLALQNVALTREVCDTQHYEHVLKSANSMADIRNKTKNVPGLKNAWENSIASMVSMLETRTSRLNLKGEPFAVSSPASDETVERFEKQISILIDREIESGKYQQHNLKSKAGKIKHKTWLII